MPKFQKILEYGLYLLVLTLPFQTRLILKPGVINGGYAEYGTISLYASDILLIVLLVLFLIGLIHQKSISFRITMPFSQAKEISDKLLFWSFLFFIGTGFFSIFIAGEKLLAIYGFVKICLGLGLFFLIIRGNYDRTKLILCVLLGIVLQSLIGIWQFIKQASFSSKYLGIAIHNASDLGTSVIEINNKVGGIGERWLRAYGGLDHPNIFGGMMVIGFFLALWVIITERNKKSAPIIFFLWASLVLCLAGMIFSFSRGAIISFLAGWVVLLFLIIRSRMWFTLKNIGKIALISGSVLLIIFSIYSALFLTRLNSEGRLEIRSTDERIESYKEGMTLIKDHWLSGAGIGNYVFSLKKLIPGKPSYFYQPVHNTFLLIWAEIGIIGLLSLVAVILTIGMKTYQHVNKSMANKDNINKISSIILNSALVSFIFLMIFDHWIWSLHFGLLFFALILGIIYFYSVNKQ